MGLGKDVMAAERNFAFLKRLIDTQCSPAFPVYRSHIPPQPACLPGCLAVCVCVCVTGSVLMVMECCLCTVCVDSSLLPEDGGGDPTREAVIAKSSVNRGHPVGRCLKMLIL